MEMIGGTCWEHGKQWVEVKHFACNYTAQNAIRELFYLKFGGGWSYTQGTCETGLHSEVFSKHLDICFSFDVDTTASYDLLILIQWVAVRSLTTVWSSFLPWRGCKEEFYWESLGGCLCLPYKPTLGEGQIPQMFLSLWPAPGLDLCWAESQQICCDPIENIVLVRTSESDQV